MIPPEVISMYGFQLLRLFEEMRELGLVTSREQFSRSWCGRSPGYVHDFTRRDGATARVSPQTIARLRMRLAEADGLLVGDLRDQIRAYDEAILRDLRIADLLGRRSVDAKCPL